MSYLKRLKFKRNFFLHLTRDFLEPISIARIAQQSGYNPLSVYTDNFSRFFKKMMEEEKIDLKWCADSFKDIHQKALKKDDLANANRSVEDLTRMQGGFKDKVETTGTQQLTIVDKATQEELLEMRRKAVEPGDN